jgi:spermidine synthase
LIALSSVAALMLLAPLGRRSFHAASTRSCAFVALGISSIFALAVIGTVSDVPWQVIAYGRRIALVMHSDVDETKTHPIRVLYRGEGLSSSVVITEQWDQRVIYVNGNTEASNASDDMRLERMAGHLPALVHAEPHDVLVVGFGAGVTAGSFVTYPQVRRIVIAELESLIPAASGQFFRRENYAVKDDPRTRLIHDDGRHYLLTNKDKFDVITSDPVHLWVKGTSSLYSKEYFEIVKRHLNPGGVIAQWVPLYDGDVETIKSVLATFFEVFPNGTVWSNHIEDRGFDLVLLGQSESTKINVDELQKRLNRSDYDAVMQSLRAVGFRSAVDVLATYLGRASDIQPWLSGAQINTDGNLRLQYLAGLEINSDASGQIYNELRRYLRYPDGLFTGTDAVIEPLKGLLQTPR